jgi:hypothetical protein
LEGYVAKTVQIHGVDFHPGQVEWEDAFSSIRAELPSFDKMRARQEPVGKVITTIGLIALIGDHWVIVTEYGTNDGIFDFTIVPMRAKVKVIWTGKKSSSMKR